MAGAVRVGQAGPVVAVTPRSAASAWPLWSATDGGHVAYESWLERDHVILLDFDPTMVGITSQPYKLSRHCLVRQLR